MPVPPSPFRGTAAGVPFLAVPPTGRSERPVPLVIAWHLMDPPRTEAAFAAALPLNGLDAWRVYLGLPMCGTRLPAGGVEELMRLGYQDAVMNLQGPIAVQGAEEFPAVLGELRERLDLEDAPLALVGGSLGSAVAQLVLTGTGPAAVTATVAVLVSPIVELRPAVDATGRRYSVTYPWGPASLAVARRMDFVARADELVHHGQPAVQLIVGANDDREGFLEPAQRLRAALADRYDDPTRVDLVVVPGMAHALTEEPGVEPAPQTARAAVVDRHAAHWLRRHLTGASATPTAASEATR